MCTIMGGMLLLMSRIFSIELKDLYPKFKKYFIYFLKRENESEYGYVYFYRTLSN